MDYSKIAEFAKERLVSLTPPQDQDQKSWSPQRRVTGCFDKRPLFWNISIPLIYLVFGPQFAIKYYFSASENTLSITWFIVAVNNRNWVPVLYSRILASSLSLGNMRAPNTKSATLEVLLNLEDAESMLIEHTLERCGNDIITGARTPGTNRPKIYPYSMKKAVSVG